ncbi:MAG TPA: hypothetical protein VM843_03740 [Flavisolibacter sp.]|nr:hypothetical protein [Flavisolibacter sp.]
MKPNPKLNKSGNSDLLRYAGLGMQLFVALGLAVFGGLKADNWLNGGKPLLVWILPLIIIVAMIYKLVKDTSKK